MLKATILASALALALAAPARAASEQPAEQRITATSPAGLHADVVEVHTRPNPVGTIAGDALAGGVAGAAIGGGVVLYQRYVSNGGNGNFDNWQRTVLIGAGIGLVAGGIFGAVDAASAQDRAATGPLADQRQTGMSGPWASHGWKF